MTTVDYNKLCIYNIYSKHQNQYIKRYIQNTIDKIKMEF